MNIKNIVASVSLLFAAGAALAEPADLNFPTLGGAPSSVSRAEVKAEVIAARSAGQLDQSEVVIYETAQPSTLTRAEVRAEVIAARAAGLLEHSEVDYPVAYQLPQRASLAASLKALSSGGSAAQ